VDATTTRATSPRLEQRAGLDHHLGVAAGHRAGPEALVGGIESLRHLERRQPPGGEPLRVEVDAHLAAEPSDERHLAHVVDLLDASSSAAATRLSS